MPLNRTATINIFYNPADIEAKIIFSKQAEIAGFKKLKTKTLSFKEAFASCKTATIRRGCAELSESCIELDRVFVKTSELKPIFNWIKKQEFLQVSELDVEIPILHQGIFLE